MKKIIPLILALALFVLSSCEKNTDTSHSVEYKVYCDSEDFEFLYRDSNGKINQLKVLGNSVTVYPMTFQNGDTYLASAAAYDLQSQVTISLYIDGVKTNPEVTEDLVFSYAISGSVN